MAVLTILAIAALATRILWAQEISNQEITAHEFAQPTPSLHEAYEQAVALEAPLRNIVHLYLRVAGIVWITVEWIAAFVVIKAYCLIRKSFKPQATSPANPPNA